MTCPVSHSEYVTKLGFKPSVLDSKATCEPELSSEQTPLEQGRHAPKSPTSDFEEVGAGNQGSLSSLSLFSFLCLINWSLEIKKPDGSFLLHPLFLLFCNSFPAQDSIKDLAGTTVTTTNFLSLSFQSEIMDGAIHWAPGL